MNVKRGWSALLWLGLAFAFLPFANAQASSQQGPSVHLSQAQSHQFKSAITALAEQGHVAIVAEGGPLHPELPLDKAPAFNNNVSLDMAINKVAEVYDYDVQRQGSVLILKKRYSDAEDLPGVTLEECRQSLEDVVRVLNAFNPHLSISIRESHDNRLVLDFVSTLTPEQEQAMQNKTLHYGDLSPEQQALILRTVLYETVQFPSQDVQRIQVVLSHAADASLYTTPHDQTRLYGQNGLFVRYPAPTRADTAAKGSPKMNWYPLTLPDVAGNLAAPTLSPRAKSESTVSQVSTLDKVVTTLNATAGQKNGVAAFEVEALLKDKPVIVAGLENVPPIEVLRALATIYGLHIGATDKGASLLERTSTSTPTNIRGLADAMRRALPEPYLRAIHDGQASPLQELPWPKVPDKATNAERNTIMRKWAEQNDANRALQRQIKMRPVTMMGEAARRLREAVMPKFRQAGLGESIPVSSLDTKTRDTIGLILMSDVVGQIYNQFLMPDQEWMTADYDQILIWGKPYVDTHWPGGRQTHSLHLDIVHPETHSVYSLGGVGYD